MATSHICTYNSNQLGTYVMQLSYIFVHSSPTYKTYCQEILIPVVHFQQFSSYYIQHFQETPY